MAILCLSEMFKTHANNSQSCSVKISDSKYCSKSCIIIEGNAKLANSNKIYKVSKWYSFITFFWTPCSYLIIPTWVNLDSPYSFLVCCFFFWKEIQSLKHFISELSNSKILPQKLFVWKKSYLIYLTIQFFFCVNSHYMPFYHKSRPFLNLETQENVWTLKHRRMFEPWNTGECLNLETQENV